MKKKTETDLTDRFDSYAPKHAYMYKQCDLLFLKQHIHVDTNSPSLSKRVELYSPVKHFLYFSAYISWLTIVSVSVYFFCQIHFLHK